MRFNTFEGSYIFVKDIYILTQKISDPDKITQKLISRNPITDFSSKTENTNAHFDKSRSTCDSTVND